MSFRKHQFKKINNNIFILLTLALLLSSFFVKCDLILRSPKDLQSQFISKNTFYILFI